MPETPRFATGYIEGYYGRMLDWKEREAVAADCGDGGFYLYAPKEDPYHRRDWKKAYPRDWLRRFAQFAAAARRRRVGVVPAMAPGLSFRYGSARDERALLGKLYAFQDAGCDITALLMDDIPDRLPPDAQKRYASLGQAHAHLLGRLLEALRKRRAAARLWFCPTVYTDQFSREPVGDNRYLLDLSREMPEEIPVFWTGPKVVPPGLAASALRPISRLFRGNVLIWDNFYADDYCPAKLFLAPFSRRQDVLRRFTRGLLLNPTGLPHTDRLLLRACTATLSGRPPAEAWRSALRSFGVPDAFSEVEIFFRYPSPALGERAFTAARIRRWRKALFQLIWEWKSPLHREWYPFLYMLDMDLSLLPAAGAGRDAEWLRRKYPPVLARLLERTAVAHD